MRKKHTEERLEDAIEYELIDQGGYHKGDPNSYDKERALFPQEVLAFIQKTQPKVWEGLKAIHKEKTEKVILDGLCKTLGSNGMLKVLRNGFKCYGKTIRVAYFAPSNLKNQDSLNLYGANRLTVVRQVKYDDAGNKPDLVLALNGLPVVTAELKNPNTGQTVEDAKRQYKYDRSPKELLFKFKARTLVHFAVDQDLVFMATQLAGSRTFFLPFNLGFHGGAGNPLAEDGGYRTSYLWREVWQRDSLMDILGRFMHLEVEVKRIPTDKGIKKRTKETMIFPRYHQLNVVRSLVNHTQKHGAGRNYLVQHSAGSGKSNSIAWLAHRLSSLHNENDDRIYNSVIVVTDRRVLDQQLQNTIYQFEHKQGVVEKIDEDTKQLAKALSSGTPIIITTLQKFPFVSETLEKLNKKAEADSTLSITTKGKRFAVIVDEAHSSQSGENAMELKHVLNKEGIAEEAAKYAAENAEDDVEESSLEIIARDMMKRSRQPNISFFAFTATPKYKTLKVFDESGPSGSAPFHLYTMRQAIEEGFIHDVLKNFTHIKTYFKLLQIAQDDPQVERKKTAKALARFLNLHAYNIRQKTEMMVEHFRTHVRHKIGGRAKAMIVTGSRLQAVRYKESFDSYIKEKGYTDVKSLVAFSGTVVDPKIPEKSWTEVSMNEGVRESELPAQFDTDEYQVLLVAEKYQTGFDQPLLHTMYVDKKLSGIQAVQTLSRLNRTTAGKDDTFVLDFVNKPEDIFKAFKPFYEETPSEPLTDTHRLYELQNEVEETGIIFEDEVADFAKVYFQNKKNENVNDHAKMNGILDKAVERFKTLEEEEQGEVKSKIISFRNLYAFLSQVIPYQDSDLEKLYTYLRFLLTKLPRRASGAGYDVEDDVQLEYYRLQKISEGSIDLSPGSADALKGPNHTGKGNKDEEEVFLSELIDVLNEYFGTDFTRADQLFFDQIQAEAEMSEPLQQAAHANSVDDFKQVFLKVFEGLVLDRMDGNEEISIRLLNDPELREVATDDLVHKIYNNIRENDA